MQLHFTQFEKNEKHRAYYTGSSENDRYLQRLNREWLIYRFNPFCFRADKTAHLCVENVRVIAIQY